MMQRELSDGAERSAVRPDASPPYRGALNEYRLAYLEEFGGVALGNLLAQTVADRESTFRVPKFEIIRVRDVSAGPEHLRRCLDDAGSLLGSSVVAKISGTREGFSPWARRGANTSTLRAPAVFRPAQLCVSLSELARSRPDLEPRAILLQEAVRGAAGIGTVIANVTSRGTSIEVPVHQDRYLVLASAESEIWSVESTRPDGSLKDLVDSVDVVRFVNAHRAAYDLLGFGFEAESLMTEDGDLAILHLRPLCPDAPLDLERQDVSAGADHTTFFTFGSFDVVADFVALDDETTLSEVETDAIALGFSERFPWRNPEVARQLEEGRTVIFVDLVNGFRLSHDPALLPSPGPERDRFRYLSAARFPQDRLVGNRLRLISSGRAAHLLVLSSTENRAI